MQKQPVKFNEWIQGGFNLYKDNFAVLFPATLIAAILSSVTLFILAGPMLVGLVWIVLRLIDGKEPKPEIGDVFKGFDLFLPSFLFFLGVGLVSIIGSTVLGIVPFFGSLLGVLFVYGLGTVVMFGIFLITEQKLDAWTAAVKSFETVKMNFWPFLGVYVVACLLSSIGFIVCGIGIVITLPLMVCILGVAYRDVFSGSGSPAPAGGDMPPEQPDQPEEPAMEATEAAAVPEEPETADK